ncbi:hypothetical protein ACI7YT_07475 [Microbacterium sp. M]|uniref:hypothetical protein n=1 Tax=Microbacterium sp. M TaxID=3377125 RepID=UPI0038691E50
MSGSRRALRATLVLALGATALTGGAVLTVFMAVAILRMGAHALFALWSWVPMFGIAGAGHPVPQYDFFSPSLAMLGGILLFSIGWVVIIRGATAAWPDRFNHAGGTLETDELPVGDDETAHSALLD